MSWDRNGNLYCNCCYKIVIPRNKVTKRDIKENIGKTFCEECKNKYGRPLERMVKKYYEQEKRRKRLQRIVPERTSKQNENSRTTNAVPIHRFKK